MFHHDVLHRSLSLFQPQASFSTDEQLDTRERVLMGHVDLPVVDKTGLRNAVSIRDSNVANPISTLVPSMVLPACGMSRAARKSAVLGDGLTEVTSN